MERDVESVHSAMLEVLQLGDKQSWNLESREPEEELARLSVCSDASALTSHNGTCRCTAIDSRPTGGHWGSHPTLT